MLLLSKKAFAARTPFKVECRPELCSGAELCSGEVKKRRVINPADKYRP
jgi:hypothetical protein